jgi:hypothetical protein
MIYYDILSYNEWTYSDYTPAIIIIIIIILLLLLKKLHKIIKLYIYIYI